MVDIDGQACVSTQFLCWPYFSPCKYALFISKFTHTQIFHNVSVIAVFSDLCSL